MLPLNPLFQKSGSTTKKCLILTIVDMDKTAHHKVEPGQ